MMDAYHYIFIQTHRKYKTMSEPHANYGLCVIIMCQYRFIKCNKCLTLVGDVDNVEAVHVW